MGAPLTIFNLYKLSASEEASFLIVKTRRREFSNANQSEENAAVEDVDKRLSEIASAAANKLGFSSAAFLATWEGGFPVGDQFYQEGPPFLCQAWITRDTKYNQFFAFGQAGTEDEFWKALFEDYKDGDLWGYEEFARPAHMETIWFIPIERT